MKNEERTYFSEQIEELKKTLTTAARLTAALAESMTDPIDCTLADLYDAEYIAESLRRTISSPAVFRAICNLTAAAILDKDEMQAIGIIERAADPEKEKASKEVKA